MAEAVEIVPIYADHLMLVKNWLFEPSTQTVTFRDLEYSHVNVGTSDGTADLFTPDYNGHYSHIWATAQVTENEGISGQNNPNSIAHFRNYQIVKLNGKYYEPSYGVTYDDLQDMQNKAIEGLIKRAEVNLNFVGQKLYNFHIKSVLEELLIKEKD